MKIKVCKFGGTSCADSKVIEKVADIIKSQSERRYVVVSAPGKRYSADEKITDILYSLAAEAAEEGECANFYKITERYTEIINGLKIKEDISPVLDEIKATIEKTADKDYAASRGEFLNAMIFAKYLGFEFVDAAEIIKFNENGTLNEEFTYRLCKERLDKTPYAVIPGFYGSLPDGAIKTFSRGGSDITGAIIARAVNAEVYENWTDVNGFMTADPRIVKNPTVIDELSYRELRELSYMGATVLHPESIFPVRVARIPINVKNTFEPDKRGTMIVPFEKRTEMNKIITGVAGRKGFTIITIEKSMMNGELGFASKILSVLAKYNVSFEHMPTGIDTLSLVIDNNELKDNLVNIEKEISAAVNPDHMEVTHDIALIATVGHGMARKVGTASKIFGTLYEAGVNICMIDQGSSEMNIIVGVEEKDYEKSIKAIYNGLLA